MIRLGSEGATAAPQKETVVLSPKSNADTPFLLEVDLHNPKLVKGCYYLGTRPTMWGDYGLAVHSGKATFNTPSEVWYVGAAKLSSFTKLYMVVGLDVNNNPNS